MKNKILLTSGLLIVLLLMHCSTMAQNLTQAEYFFDTDIGFGMGTPIIVTPGTEVDFETSISVTGLDEGFHTLFIRFRNENGTWGLYESRTIYVQSDTESQVLDLVAAEFFFDTDPGFGAGKPINFTSGTSLDFTTDISTIGLEKGFHTLFIRFMNELGVWGHYESRNIYVQPDTESQVLDLVAAEYFFDTDPGFGSGIQIGFTTGVDLDFTADISTLGLEEGFHTLFIRFMNERGVWGNYESRNIYVQAQTESQVLDLVAAEYFFDTDPGFGSGTPIDFTPGIEVDFTADISTVGLDEGFHTLYIRFKNELGVWSHYENRTVYIQPNNESQTYKLTDAEYFIDTDPGFGNGAPIAISDGFETDLMLEIPVTGLTVGTHTIFVRFKNEQDVWGLYEYGEFEKANCMESEPEFSYQDICVGGEVTFTDLSTDVYAGTTYAWDIGNDGSVEYTTKGNIAHTFTEVGTYPVRLQLTNPDGCTKMAIHDVKVYPYPNVPVITADGALTICDNSTVELSVPDVNYSYLWSNSEVTSSIHVSLAGDYSVTVANEIGCSAISAAVTISTIATYNETDAATICQGDSYIFGTQTLNVTGVYTEVFESLLGCDSTVVLTLTVNPVYNISENHSICQGATYTWQGTVYTTAGVYSKNYTSKLGCDSILILNLTIYAALDISTTLNNKTITANANGVTYQWINCSNNSIIPGEVNKTFTPIANGNYAVRISNGICTYTSSCVNISTVGIEINTNKLFEVSIFPNPTDGLLTISTGDVIAENIQITNLLGQCVLTLKPSTNSSIINFKEFNNGIYFIRLLHSNKIKTVKIIKND